MVEKIIEKDDVYLLMGCDGVFERLSDIQIRNEIFAYEKKGDVEQGLDNLMKKTLSQTLHF